MADSKADLILHPIRMRIIQCFMNEEALTAQQIRQYLEEIPQATLYRHLKILEKGHILEIVEENKIRGAVEKVYALKESEVSLTKEELEAMNSEELMTLFTKFVSGLIGQFQSYLDQGTYDLFKDGVSFRQAAFNLDEEEFRDMLKEVRSVYQKYMKRQPKPGRKKRTVATIILPEK